MARISGINIPLNKRIEIGLTYIYGIGRSGSNEILAATGIDRDTKVRDLTEEQVAALRDHIDRDVVV
jgi:small subunit ribosomal protein S13